MASLTPKPPHKAKPTTATPSKLPSSDRESKVRVIVRVRPYLAREIASMKGEFPIPCVSVLNEEENEVSVHLKDQESRRNECYKLDGFFGQDDHNLAEIFDKEVRPLIPRIFQGFNATVFAYGATGSGKTYTMQGTDEQPGLVVQAMSRILSICESTGSKAEISYYEVYLDRCYDLLELKAKEITVLEDKDGEVHKRGLSHVHVSSMAEFQEVFSLGIQRRKVAGLNDTSSRSHGVLVITVSQLPRYNVSTTTISGKLNLIDLADNRWTGIRLQESSKISQSLLALSNVIYALEKNQLPVPYRDSKLTRILQDSLGGTSHAVMVTCLNPGEYQESVRTVSLVACSRQITNFASSASKHETPKDRLSMKAKLHDWLESKGKTKSSQRMGTFASPLYGRTPRRLMTVPQRKLFTWDTVLNPDSTGIDPQREEENRAYQITSPQRKALSNIDSNISIIPVEETPVSEQDHVSLLFETTPPKTPSQNTFVVTREKFQDFDSALDKFQARSSNVKNFLQDEYMDFLNTATREELLALKGIGPKRAGYIMELRQTNPLKSLGDLQEIGLSLKQVQNMFGSAARGIFQDHNFNS